MVQALVSLSDEVNQVVNIVKARHRLRTKSEAIELVVRAYAVELMEPELRPEYVRKLRRLEKQKIVPIADFAKHYGLD